MCEYSGLFYDRTVLICGVVLRSFTESNEVLLILVCILKQLGMGVLKCFLKFLENNKRNR